MAVNATIPQVPAEPVTGELLGIEVFYKYESGGEARHWCKRIPADKLPPAWVTALEAKIKAWLEKTES